MPDAATEARQRELEARHRDLTKPVPQLGSTPESLRSIKGFENITDAFHEERATFNLKAMPGQIVRMTKEVDLAGMSRQELLDLADAILTEASRRPEGAD